MVHVPAAQGAGVKAARSVCWQSTWNPQRPDCGFEHLLLRDGLADSVIVAIDPERGPLRIGYRLNWDAAWRIQEAQIALTNDRGTRTLHVLTDGRGHWRHRDGRPIEEFDGCIDIDIWPTPFTNTFPIQRETLAIGERREFLMAWISAPELTFIAQPQAYTRLDDRLYRFENLDGSGFTADLPVDDAGLVLDYPEFFRRVR